MTKAEIDNIRALAEKATKGQWRSECHCVSVGTWNDKSGPYTIAHASVDDAAYIAAVQPRVILNLLRELELMQVALMDKENE